MIRKPEILEGPDGVHAVRVRDGWEIRVCSTNYVECRACGTAKTQEQAERCAIPKLRSCELAEDVRATVTRQKLPTV